jgi:hypothetical protein
MSDVSKAQKSPCPKHPAEDFYRATRAARASLSDDSVRLIYFQPSTAEESPPKKPPQSQK